MAYTLLDLVADVQDDLKDASFSSSRITRYLNAGQQAIFNTHAFRFCEQSYTGTLTAGAVSKTQQTDHQSTIGGSIVDPADNRVVLMLDEDSYLPHREFFETYPSASVQTAGSPTAWTEFGGSMYFDRPADKTYTFNQRYYRIATDLSANTDVPTVPQPFREALNLYALWRAEKYRGNHDVAATYKQEFEDVLEAMAIRYSPTTHVAVHHARQRRVRFSE